MICVKQLGAGSHRSATCFNGIQRAASNLHHILTCTEMVYKARSGLPRAAKITRSLSGPRGGRWPLLKKRPDHWQQRWTWDSCDKPPVPEFFELLISVKAKQAAHQISCLAMLLRLPWRYPHESKQQGSHPSGTCCCKSREQENGR